MNNHNQSMEIESITCEVCLKEAPHSEMHNAEVDDYVLSFCGLECYEKWQTEKSETE